MNVEKKKTAKFRWINILLLLPCFPLKMFPLSFFYFCLPFSSLLFFFSSVTPSLVIDISLILPFTQLPSIMPKAFLLLAGALMLPGLVQGVMLGNEEKWKPLNIPRNRDLVRTATGTFWAVGWNQHLPGVKHTALC